MYYNNCNGSNIPYHNRSFFVNCSSHNFFLCFDRLLPEVRTLAGSTQRSKHTLPDLPYSYDALAPVVSGEIMEIHHKKHHQTYVNNLNAAEEKLEEAFKTSMTIIYLYFAK